MPVWHRALWDIAMSSLTIPRRMLTTSQWMILEPVGGMMSTASQGIKTDLNMHRVERAMLQSFQDEYSKRESKDIWVS